MGRIVIVGYKPKLGKSEALKRLIATHVPRLRVLGLATDREPVCMEASDGTLLEMFEWSSAEAIQAAHGNEAVGEMWSEFAEVCDYVPVAHTAESAMLFSEYAAVDLAEWEQTDD